MLRLLGKEKPLKKMDDVNVMLIKKIHLDDVAANCVNHNLNINAS